MKVAVASSGLGHIARGIETWARDTALALHRHGIDVTLFAAAPLASAAGPVMTIPCLKRNDTITRMIARYAPGWSWRWHLKSMYEIEQWSFWLRLQRHLKQGHYEILHVQDPVLASLAQTAYQKGRMACRCILAHGTEEPAAYLQRFTYLQHLAPWHLEQTLQTLAIQHAPPDTTNPFPGWTVLPNFVDTGRFHPVGDAADQRSIREHLKLPLGARIWGTAAAIKTHHKRIDWLIREFARAAAKDPDLHLVVAGSKQTDTDALVALATAQCPGRITFKVNVPHQEMPELLRALDAFVLTSLFEMMPIAILEAISTGLPVFTHEHPVLAWMAGPGGQCVPMDQPGLLAAAMCDTPRTTLQTIGQKARGYALATFAVDQVIPTYIAYYKKILQTS